MGHPSSAGGRPWAAVVAVAVASAAQAMAPPRVVVLVTVDTLRADHVGCYGYPLDTTPFLDSLAARGVRMMDDYSPSPTTGPAHASMFTSLYPVEHGVRLNGDVLETESPTMAELFDAAGYCTAAFTSVRFLGELARGFEVFDAAGRPAVVTTRQPKRRGPAKYVLLDTYRPARATTDSVLEWLGSQAAAQRFFLWVHFYDPHMPRQPPQRHLDALALPSDRARADWIRFLEKRQGMTGRSYRGLAAMADDVRRYDAEIRYVDDELRRLFDVMSARGLNDDALWIVTADHGEGLGNHQSHGHDDVYDEILHVPLVIARTSESYGGGARAGLVSHLDLLPTVAELLAAAPGALMEGASLLPALEGRPWTGAANVLAETEVNRTDPVRPTFTIRAAAGLKYIVRPGGPEQLFDVRADPFELENLVDGSTVPGRELRALLLRTYGRLVAHRAQRRATDEYDEELRALGYIE